MNVARNSRKLFLNTRLVTKQQTTWELISAKTLKAAIWRVFGRQNDEEEPVPRLRRRIPIPEVIYNINAFALGAQSVNPDAKVSVVWSNTWYDPTTERQAAISLLDKGADVLLAYQDSPATVQAAAERGAFAGGNDSDMSKYAPDAYLTNPTWNWGPYYTKIVKAVQDGTWTNEQYIGSMSDGMVDIAPLGPKVPDDVKKIVEDAKKKILAGSLNVFSGQILEVAERGREAEAGETMNIEDILKMDGLLKG